ncbi:MAG: response regulator [Pseudomonadales bacterium]|nr:response regulator [Pseudomonadales bacterium]
MPNQQLSNFRSISYRLTLYVGLFGLCCAILIACALFYNNYINELSETTDRLNTLESTLLPSLAQAMWEFNQNNIHTLLEGMLQTQDVVYVKLEIHSETGNKIIEYGQSPLSAGFYQAIIHHHPIYYSDSHIQVGQLTLGASTEPVILRIQQSAGQILLTIVFVILMVAFFIIWIVNRLLTRHIQYISRFTSNLTVSNLDQNLLLQRSKSSYKSRDELDILSEAINKMRIHLREDINQRQKVEYELNLEKQATFKLEQQQKITEAANKAKGEFLAAMSHEIRTPMNGVMGMLDMLADSSLTQDQHYYLDMAITSSDSLRFIIDDILDYSKLDAGKMRLESIQFDLVNLITECLQSIFIAAQKNNITLFADINYGTPTLLVGDPYRLKQVLINLLGNAVKFTESGHICITAEDITEQHLKKKTGSACRIKLSVNDTGIGIEEDKQRLLFSPFTQADQSTTRRFGGSGLGLAICKQIVHLMQGEIQFNSQVNQGSHFHLSLPFTASSTGPIEETLNEFLHPPVSLKPSVLLISDNAFLSDCLSKHLNNTHSAIHLAANNDASINMAIENKSYSDIIIDYSQQGFVQAPQLTTLLSHLKSPSPLHLICTPTESFSAEQCKILNLELHFHPLTSLDIYQFILAGKDSKKPKEDSDSTEMEKYDDFSFLSVLVVDDNEINRMVAKGFLQRLSISPSLSESGEQTLEMIEKQLTFDIIFMDCEMPGLDGFETTERIRQNEEKKGITRSYIVALTANVLQQHKEQAKAAGMDSFLAKPLKNDALKQCIQTYIQSQHIAD